MGRNRQLWAVAATALIALALHGSAGASPDVDGDGLVNVVDVQTVVNGILAGETAAQQPALDVDGDGLVNVIDVQRIVNDILMVAPTPLVWRPAGTQAWQGLPFALQLTATGGQGTYAWTLMGGALPPGLTVSLGGLISGTPSATGVFTLSVRATDTNNGFHTRSIAISVGTPSPPQITSTAPATGTKGKLFRYQLMTAGQPTPVLNVTGLPAWLNSPVGGAW